MNNIKTTQTDFGYLSQMWFKPTEIVQENFWKADFPYEKNNTFYIQYLQGRDCTPLDPQLANKIAQLFIHLNFPQEASVKNFSNPCLRCAACYDTSELIAKYAQKTFPELNIQLLGNPRMSRTFSEDSKAAILQDPIKDKYMRPVFGCFHVLVYGQYNGLYFAFDSLGIDLLQSVMISELYMKPLTQVFIASNNKELQEILSHRFISQENWIPFKVTDNFGIGYRGKPLADY